MDTALHSYDFLSILLTLFIRYSPLLRQESGHDINMPCTPILLPEESTFLSGLSGLRAPGSPPQFCHITLEPLVTIAPCHSQALQIDHIARTRTAGSIRLQACYHAE